MVPSEIAVVIVTFQSEAWIGPCLQSVAADTGSGTTVIVVDNASTDATLHVVRETLPTATVLPLATNLGFAYAANRGAELAGGADLMFLNPDAKLSRGATQTLVVHMAENPGVAAAGPSLAFPDGSPQDAAFTYPSLLMTWLEFFPQPGRLLHGRLNGRLHSSDGRPIPVDHPLGACMVVRREAWTETGPFDEQFFLYCEEVDWCTRARRLGWSISHVPSALVFHRGGASADQAPGPSLVHLYTSRLRLHRKHRSVWFRALARFITCLGLAQERRRLRNRGAETTAARLAALERAAHLAHQ